MTQIKKTHEHTVDTLFILALFVVFAASSFLIVFIGARQYRNIVNRMDQNYETRTCASYLEEKIHQSDLADSVSIATIDDTTALALSMHINENSYTTYIYTYDGMLREILIADGTDFSLSDGQSIVEATDFSAEFRSSSLLALTVTDQAGNPSTLYLNLQSVN